MEKLLADQFQDSWFDEGRMFPLSDSYRTCMHARREWPERSADTRASAHVVGRTNRWCIEAGARAIHIDDARLHLWLAAWCRCLRTAAAALV
jgi:hypothetical protein